jgi:hypothetical protein
MLDRQPAGEELEVVVGFGEREGVALLWPLLEGGALIDAPDFVLGLPIEAKRPFERPSELRLGKRDAERLVELSEQSFGAVFAELDPATQYPEERFASLGIGPFGCQQLVVPEHGAERDEADVVRHGSRAERGSR